MHESGNTFFEGGGDVRGSLNLGGSSTSFKSKKFNFMQFSYSVTPPPRASGSATAADGPSITLVLNNSPFSRFLFPSEHSGNKMTVVKSPPYK